MNRPQAAEDGHPPEGSPIAGVVHDLGNLIQIAASALNMVHRNARAASDTDLESVLVRARTALDRAGALVHQAMGRSSAGDGVGPTSDRQDIAFCLAGIRPLIAWTCQPHISLSWDIERGLPPVRCEEIDLQNAVLNLVINARDAQPGGGSIRIAARPGSSDGRVALSVADEGAGMAPEILAQALSPYFTTKGGRGAGLGLAMVKRFADQTGGEVDIASTPGTGTTVTLHLPVAEDSGQAGGGRPKAALASSG